MTAQSGTGKTATFSISILQTINTTQRETQALVLSPTRELATQIQSVILALGEYLNVPPPSPKTSYLHVGSMSRMYRWHQRR
jgi:superfamily II DNA/RNA helicase